MEYPFELKDCALIAIATGEKAQTLRELRDRLTTTHQGCIYYHFWGGLLEARFDDPEFQNDFAAWAWRSLHDAPLAERLAIIDPKNYENMDALRRELIEVIEERLDESELLPWTRAGNQFRFIRSQVVVFDTKIRIHTIEELKEAIPRMSQGSVFYHFIDARRRTEKRGNDFSEWVVQLGEPYEALANQIRAIDPYFTSLSELKEELEKVIAGFKPREDA